MDAHIQNRATLEQTLENLSVILYQWPDFAVTHLLNQIASVMKHL